MAITHGPLRVVGIPDRNFCMLGSYLMPGTQLSVQMSVNNETENSRVSQTLLYSE